MPDLAENAQADPKVVKMNKEIEKLDLEIQHLKKPDWRKPTVIVPWALAIATLSLGFLTGSIQTSLTSLGLLREKVAESQAELEREESALASLEALLVERRSELEGREAEQREKEAGLAAKEKDIRFRLANIDTLSRATTLVESMTLWEDQHSFRQPCQSLIQLSEQDDSGAVISGLRTVAKEGGIEDIVLRCHVLGVIAHLTDDESDWAALQDTLSTETAKQSPYAHHVMYGPIDWTDNQIETVIKILADLVSGHPAYDKFKEGLYWRAITVLQYVRKNLLASDPHAIAVPWETQIIYLEDARNWYIAEVEAGTPGPSLPREPMELLALLMPGALEVLEYETVQFRDGWGPAAWAIYTLTPGPGGTRDGPSGAPSNLATEAEWDAWARRNRDLIEAVMQEDLETLKQGPSLVDRLAPLPWK